jgi:plasmid stabilization system protein ParE
VTVKIVVRKGAARDIQQAHDWYESEQVGLGKEFLDEIGACFSRIERHPDGYAFTYRDTKRAIVERFPYSIYFRLRDDEVRIIAIAHQRRKPKVWQSRIRSP